jgi:hypothetical protein
MLKCLAILAVFVATWHVVAQVPRQGGKQQDHSTEYQAPTNDHGQSLAQPSLDLRITIIHNGEWEEKHNAAQEQSHNWKEAFWPGTWSNWALVFVGGFAGFFAWRTLRKIRRQTDLMNRQTIVSLATAKSALAQVTLIKQKERARIMVNILRLEKLYIGIEPGNKIMMQVENTGSTQAQNVRGEFEATILVDGFDPLNTRDEEMQDMVLQNVMRPNQPPIETYLFFSIPDRWSEEIGIVNPRITITIRGIVEYEDIFGEPHTTPFKYRFFIPKILKWLGNDVAETHPFSKWRQDGPEGNIAT